MLKTQITLFFLLISFFITACSLKLAPVTPPAVTTSGLPEPSVLATATQPLPINLSSTDTLTPMPNSTLPPELSTISGEFVLTNTSASVMEVGVETMDMILEYRLSIAGQWRNIKMDCSFEPAAPLVLKEELTVRYKCSPQIPAPGEAELRLTAEVTIHGSDEVFRIEVEPP